MFSYLWIATKHFIYSLCSTVYVPGGMYDELIDILLKKSNDTLAPDRKIYVYSGHDTTVIPMQVALGVDSVIAPVRAGSALIVELHQDPDTSEHYVKVHTLNKNNQSES